jgi:hypothetical protein
MRVEHRHGRRCYWDHLRCGWVCGVEEEDVPVVVVEREEPVAEPVPVAVAVT